jgi:hypothetical protein
MKEKPPDPDCYRDPKGNIRKAKLKQMLQNIVNNNTPLGGGGL